MNKLLAILLLLAAALWLYDDSRDGDRIDALEKEVAAAEAKVRKLEGELASVRADFASALNQVETANVAINTILDKAGRDIDEGLKGIQRLKAVNQSYDAAVVAVRGKCAAAVRGAGAGNL